MSSPPPDLHFAKLNGYRYIVEIKREPFYWLATTPVLPGVEFRGDAREEVIYKVETAAREGTKIVDWWRRAAMDHLLGRTDGLSAVDLRWREWREEMSAQTVVRLAPEDGVGRVICTACGARFNGPHREMACPHRVLP